MKCKTCEREICKQNKTGYCRHCVTKTQDHKEKNSAGLRQMHLEGRGFTGGRRFTEADRLKGLQIFREKRHKRFIEGNSKFHSGSLRYNLVMSGRIEQCEKCGASSSWQNEPLVLDVDHIDGDRTNNKLENLRFLCPNCHSQTPTYRGRNINSGRKKITDEELTEALQKERSIHAALVRVGLAPKGGNYSRACKLLEKTYSME